MLIEKLKQRFGAEILSAENARGEDSIFIGRDHAFDTFRALRDEVGFEFNFLTDLTAVDWLERKPRYDVVYHLNSLTLAATGARRTGSSANASTCSGSISKAIPICAAS